jgi:hypothetical protein
MDGFRLILSTADVVTATTPLVLPLEEQTGSLQYKESVILCLNFV